MLYEQQQQQHQQDTTINFMNGTLNDINSLLQTSYDEIRQLKAVKEPSEVSGQRRPRSQNASKEFSRSLSMSSTNSDSSVEVLGGLRSVYLNSEEAKPNCFEDDEEPTNNIDFLSFEDEYEVVVFNLAKLLTHNFIKEDVAEDFIEPLSSASSRYLAKPALKSPGSRFRPRIKANLKVRFNLPEDKHEEPLGKVILREDTETSESDVSSKVSEDTAVEEREQEASTEEAFLLVQKPDQIDDFNDYSSETDCFSSDDDLEVINPSASTYSRSYEVGSQQTFYHSGNTVLHDADYIELPIGQTSVFRYKESILKSSGSQDKPLKHNFKPAFPETLRKDGKPFNKMLKFWRNKKQ
eukprot:augustus_masked-scaffold_5-processed-gene-11.46-mRNA-1 protein AED:0.10 eAED:1.00 QI:0/-1/0/1/-1/1/1/0/351